MSIRGMAQRLTRQMDALRDADEGADVSMYVDLLRKHFNNPDVSAAADAYWQACDARRQAGTLEQDIWNIHPELDDLMGRVLCAIHVAEFGSEAG